MLLSGVEIEEEDLIEQVFAMLKVQASIAISTELRAGYW